MLNPKDEVVELEPALSRDSDTSCAPSDECRKWTHSGSTIHSTV